MTDEIEAAAETAKAVQELAKTSGQAIGAAEKFGGFISRTISGPLEQGAGIFEDKLKYMRWERQQRLMIRADEFMTSQGLHGPTRAIPLKLAVPLFQAASMEDDNHLQDMWARLLVNGIDANSKTELTRAYIDILERLTPLEAKLMEAMYSIPMRDELEPNAISGVGLPENVVVVNDDDQKKGLEQPSDKVKLALANLARLGCVTLPVTWGGGRSYVYVLQSLLGSRFIEACTLQK